MRIQVDRSVCALHGDCVVQSPDLFDLDEDDDAARVLDENPTEDKWPSAERAASGCPARAITITN